MTTPKTGSPELSISQSGKEATVNEALRRIEAGANRYVVVDRDLSSPPAACADGACYIVAATGGGAWTGHTGEVAEAAGANASNGWYFRAPEEGVVAFIQDEGAELVYDGSAWAPSGAGDLVSTNNLSDVADAVVAGANLRPVECIVLVCSDETTALTAGASKVVFRLPYAFTVTAVRASLSTPQTSGSVLTVDVNEAGTSILSTKLTFDNGEKTTTTAATPAVISDPSLADDADLTVDIDQVGDGTAKGLKVALIGHRT